MFTPNKKKSVHFSVRFISFTLLAPCKLFKDNAKQCFVIYPLIPDLHST